MYIVTKLKLDQKQLPYWSLMLVHKDGNIMHEVVSQTFDINHKFNKWKQFEMASNRMAKEIMSRGDAKDQYNLSRMFLQESKYDKTENVNG